MDKNDRTTPECTQAHHFLQCAASCIDERQCCRDRDRKERKESKKEKKKERTNSEIRGSRPQVSFFVCVCFCVCVYWCVRVCVMYMCVSTRLYILF